LDLISYLFLGSVQGLTEFLPISSSGHIELFSKYFNFNISNLTFDITVHLASLFAVLLFFKLNYSNSIQNNNEILSNRNLIFFSFIPIGVFGILFRDFLNNDARELLIIGISFIFSGIIISLHFFKKYKVSFFYIIIFASIFQTFAAFPGISRSGMVIGVSVLLGLELRKSIILSFLMSIPLIIISSSYELIMSILNGFSQIELQYLLVAFISSFFMSYLGIKLMVFVSKFFQLRIFGFYNLILGITILILSFI
tara:strand:+ start:555 stop:1316 length:762 start_codon:yes stop_codon:yes gene_type:complete